MVGCVITTQAQTINAPSKPDSVLLSDAVEGDYQVKRYLVSEADDADYVLHYRINNATMNRSMNGNEAELIDLKNLVTGFLSDSLNEVEQVKIKGYASPDGPLPLNRSLAKRRAEDVKKYVDQQYHFSKNYRVTLDSEVPAWSSLREAVVKSSIPMKDSVLMILDSRHSEVDKQLALKRMPKVWNYLAAHILPAMRKVDLEVDYLARNVAERRIPIAKPKAEPEVVVVEEVVEQVDPCCRELCESDQLGVIVDMTEVEVDF